MPNWAYGPVTITGTRQNISRFVSRFIFDEDRKLNSNRRYFFARSFTNCSKAEVMQNIKLRFEDSEKEDVKTFCLDIDFAWSARGCLDGHYSENAMQCISLEDACILDDVSVEIQTEEGGERIEEYIFCDEYGTSDINSSNMPEFACKKCGNTMGIASFNDPNESSCCECGSYNWEPIASQKRKNAI